MARGAVAGGAAPLGPALSRAYGHRRASVPAAAGSRQQFFQSTDPQIAGAQGWTETGSSARPRVQGAWPAYGPANPRRVRAPGLQAAPSLIGVGTRGGTWPLPPNRTGGFPASGYPVNECVNPRWSASIRVLLASSAAHNGPTIHSASVAAPRPVLDWCSRVALAAGSATVAARNHPPPQTRWPDGAGNTLLVAVLGHVHVGGVAPAAPSAVNFHHRVGGQAPAGFGQAEYAPNSAEDMAPLSGTGFQPVSLQFTPR